MGLLSLFHLSRASNARSRWVGDINPPGLPSEARDPRRGPEDPGRKTFRPFRQGLCQRQPMSDNLAREAAEDAPPRPVSGSTGSCRISTGSWRRRGTSLKHRARRNRGCPKTCVWQGSGKCLASRTTFLRKSGKDASCERGSGRRTGHHETI